MASVLCGHSSVLFWCIKVCSSANTPAFRPLPRFLSFPLPRPRALRLPVWIWPCLLISVSVSLPLPLFLLILLLVFLFLIPFLDLYFSPSLLTSVYWCGGRSQYRAGLKLRCRYQQGVFDFWISVLTEGQRRSERTWQLSKTIERCWFIGYRIHHRSQT